MLENQQVICIDRLLQAIVRPMTVVTAEVLVLIASPSDDVLSDDDCSLFFFDDAGRGNIFQITQGIELKWKKVKCCYRIDRINEIIDEIIIFMKRKMSKDKDSFKLSL
ncbi:hypothetical protein DERP_000193 [Dermatophagoides pteronyssinus]|uniref:Uncharacterized protein n=1 Tax=Dermatophagoides pteronyssinus TaxID=6956 RepID=A0ABQ8IZG3_DERPT|nr:hypothetical protein DERP_000193 [Dermatophagoides pteronyssinus]